MRSICASIVTTLAIASGVSAETHAVLTNSHIELTRSTPRADGGWAGGGPIPTHEHGDHCISDIDRANIRKGIARYIEQFGPLSTPNESGAPALYQVYPMGGVLWDDVFTSNFVDLDPNDTDILDWNCGNHTYDGHKGSDTLILSFEHQAIGVPIVAALDGTVVSSHDGEFDQNTEWLGGSSNHVIIDHDEGRLCYYAHMKRGSVRVTAGQQVRAGEEIGLVASSGNSNWPHLHFQTEIDGVVVEPYTGDCNPGESLWVDQVNIPTNTRLLDFGATVSDLNDFYSKNTLHWRAPTDAQIPLDHEKVWFWTLGTHLPAWSTSRFFFYTPSGSLYYDSDWFWINPTPLTHHFWYGYFNWDLVGMQTTPGTWTVEMLVNGEPYINFPIDVVEVVDPDFNRAPQPIVAVIKPSSPTAEDILTCRLYTAGPLDDLDWDLVRFHYTWSIGGRVVRETVSAAHADHLPRLEGCDGAVVQCHVVPSDGTASGDPRTARVRLSGESNGDPNCDGSVNVYDLLIVLNDWGSCDVCSGDLNGDGETGIYDLLILLDNWG